MIDSGESTILAKDWQVERLGLFEHCLRKATTNKNCLVHNDFWFEHIWTVGYRLVVIDFGLERVAPVGRDAIQLYCRLFDMAIFNPLVPLTARDDVIKSFLDGFGMFDTGSHKNVLWQLRTRTEQLAGLTEYLPAESRGILENLVRQKALVQQIIKLRADS